MRVHVSTPYLLRNIFIYFCYIFIPKDEVMRICIKFLMLYLDEKILHTTITSKFNHVIVIM